MGADPFIIVDDLRSSGTRMSRAQGAHELYDVGRMPVGFVPGAVAANDDVLAGSVLDRRTLRNPVSRKGGNAVIAHSFGSR